MIVREGVVVAHEAFDSLIGESRTLAQRYLVGEHSRNDFFGQSLDERRLHEAIRLGPLADFDTLSTPPAPRNEKTP
ncbi:hypothetical protein D9M70_574580 [compost metagenome]